MHFDLASALSIVSTLAVVLALLFAGLQVREANRLRSDQAAVAMIETTQSERWSRALDRIGQLAPNAAASDVEALPEEMRAMLLAFGVHLEPVGYMVHQRMITLETVDDLVGGVTLMYWARAKPWVETTRAKTGNPKLLEWCQWLAERIGERHARSRTKPAYLRDADWRE